MADEGATEVLANQSKGEGNANMSGNVTGMTGILWKHGMLRYSYNVKCAIRYHRITAHCKMVITDFTMHARPTAQLTRRSTERSSFSGFALLRTSCEGWRGQLQRHEETDIDHMLDTF